MKVCVPVDQDNGIDSIPSMGLEAAPLFIILDTGSGAAESIENTGLSGEGEAGDPLRALQGLKIDILITGDAADNTLKALAEKGVKVYRSIPGTIGGNLEVLNMGDLDELRPGAADE